MRTLLLLGILLFIIGTTIVLAAELPPALQKGKEANNLLAQETLRTVTFFVAFLAGVITILSPCILPLLPAFFSYTFKEKQKIFPMTTIFFLGFTIIFLVLGILATSLGLGSISLLQGEISTYIAIAGIILIFLGILTFLGIGFSGIISRGRQIKPDKVGIFSYGILFGLGWTACIGPILAGILTMASVLGNYLWTSLLMIFYSLGIFLPLFLLSTFYDRSKKIQELLSHEKTWSLNIGKKIYQTRLTNIIAALLLIGTGLLFIIYKGTGVINGTNPFGLKEYFYRFQDLLTAHLFIANILGIIGLVTFIFLVWFNVRHKKSR